MEMSEIRPEQVPATLMRPAMDAGQPPDAPSSASSTTVTVNREDLAAVYGYARHFDVDSDPAMKRVSEALA